MGLHHSHSKNMIDKNISSKLCKLWNGTFPKLKQFFLSSKLFTLSSNYTLLLLVVSLAIFYTATAWSATIFGNVDIEGRKDLSGVLVTVKEKNLSGITKQDGAYSIPDVPAGSFTLIAQKPGCLVEVQSDVVIRTELVKVDFRLKPGDLKIDNQINLLDRLVLTSVWGAKKGDPNWDSMMDIYEDGVIDDKDKDLLLAQWREGNPNIKLGSLEVLSNPDGAAISINGADTGKITPYIFTGVVVGKYDITLVRENYAPRKDTVQVKENEITSINPILDNQPPEFVDWTQDPANLTEDTEGRLRVSVQIVDKGGSGLSEKAPQFDYHIGTNTTYAGYKEMIKGTGDLWYYDIPQPVEFWDAYRGKYVYFKAKAQDTAGNEAESPEQREIIDDINDPPAIRLTSTFDIWEKGLISIEAEASDTDGTIAGVRFEYSFDNARWTQIGSMDTTSPYSVAWDTITSVRDVLKNVWIRVTALDNNDATAEFSTKTPFGIDNQPPVTNNDYDKLWHNADFTINLQASDGDGIGVSKIGYRLNNGTKQEIAIDGQKSALVNITTEGANNVLEYWSIDELGNEETHKILSGIKLDRTKPTFAEWKQDPADLTEDSRGRLRISVQVADEGQSGLEGKIPQFDYHIGRDSRYDGYENMLTEDGKTWLFSIPEPIDTWDAYRGEYVYYKAKISDVAGNEAISLERSELIEDINDLPVVSIKSAIKPWIKGTLTIEADSSDTDGTIVGVQFEYSSDKIAWIPIGPMDTSAPYSVEWDTTASIKTQSVWIRVVATDSGGATATSIYPIKIGIDNEPPVTKDDYNGLWHILDFAVILTADDGAGIGVSINNIKYKLNDSEEKNLSRDGQPWITKEGTNQLEYWSLDDLGNAETHRKLTNIKLDKTPPEFVDWLKEPANLTEDSTGPLRISVRVLDAGGSGLTGKVTQFSYRTGKDKPYSEYKNMIKGEASNVWYYEIPQPAEFWDAYRGKYINYKIKVEDVAGNQGESTEQEELIDDINDAPVVNIKTKFNAWEKGSIKIEADASDSDGTIAGVQFEYSFNKISWTPIGTLITIPPYSTQWDTKIAIPEVAQTVWIKATARDNNGYSVEQIILNSFRIDNQSPVTTQDYDGLWHNKDFAINLRISDRNGIGVATVSYRLNNGDKKDIQLDSQVSVSVTISVEGADNVLEYWSTDKLGNEEAHETISGIKLDKTAPEFTEWKQDPANLTEDTTGKFRVSVQTTDKGGSGLAGKIPQIDYRIGRDQQYDGYENMVSDDGKTWRFDIPEPMDTWNVYRDQNVFYKVRVDDIAGNVAESPEQRELIDSINDSPVVKLASTFRTWEGGKVTIKADASDKDGSVPAVQFYRSINLKDWILIGTGISASPEFSIVWDTTVNIPTLEKIVWVKVTATDADDNSVIVEDTAQKSFGVDNQPATFGEWTKSPQDLTEDIKGPLRVQAAIDDGAGSGVAKAEMTYRIGNLIPYRSFMEMKPGAGNVWYFDIPEPTGTWDKYRGETLYFKGRASDTVGNETPETAEQQELINDINDPPRGLITSSYPNWQKGSIIIQADVTDDDGQITGAQFQYSTDNATWTNIGTALIRPPYMVTWNTTVIEADQDVWVRILITDDDNASTEAVITRSFGIDNKAPTYVKWLHNNLTEDFEDIFRVEATITDAGSGVDNFKVELKYRIGSAAYSEYRTMFRKTGSTDTWFYEIPRPAANWNSYAGQTLYYMVRAADIAGNVAEGDERSEYIEPTTGNISGIITPRQCWVTAKVTAQQNGVNIKQVSVSQIDGSYSITRLRPGLYDLVVTATGYGTNRSMTGIEVKAGVDSLNHSVELYTYTTETIEQFKSGTIEFEGYRLVIESNTLEGKVALGFSGREPTTIPNSRISLLGRAVGVGFQGRSINQQMKLIVPRPDGITDGKSVMAFIYNGLDYRFVDQNYINPTDTAITILLNPEDVYNFSDQSHSFDKVLSRTADTVFYVLVTRFSEPQVVSSNLGIRNTISPPSQINIVSSDRKIALLIHGITSDSDDFSNIISTLRSLNYYEHILVFNYSAGDTISTSSSLLINELSRVIPTSFDGKIDVIAHCMGGLVARRAITAGGDSRIGSLTMLGTPNGGVDISLLKISFAALLKKTSSDPVWTYYRDGWQDIISGSSTLTSINNQLGRPVNTHYYGIAATGDNDGLVSLLSANYTDNLRFPNLERPLTESFEVVTVIPPLSEGPEFMSRTSHVAMIKATNVISKVATYLLGRSSDVKYESYDGDLVPGQHLEQFKVVLKNTGATTIQSVIAKLSTQNSFIRKSTGQQGLDTETANFGDIPANGTKTGTYSFNVSTTATAAIGQQVTFTLSIRNGSDNSVATQQFNAAIGGNLIQIALDTSNNKMVSPDVRNTAPTRPENDGDPAVEPGETMGLDITLKSNSTSSIPNISAILKTTDARVTGRVPVYTGTQITGWNTVNLATTGITATYGTLSGNTPKAMPFQFVKINDTFTPLGEQVHFTLDLKSESNFIGRDEFDIKVGANIVLDQFSVDSDLKPGGPARDIDVRLRNITSSDIRSVRISLDVEETDVDIANDREDIDTFRANSTETISFETTVDADFSGYAHFTVNIEVNRVLINTERASYYFGKLTQQINHWIASDDNSNGIVDPGENIRLQIARWNPTTEIAQDVGATINTSDTVIIKPFGRDVGDYGDVSTNSAAELRSRREYEFTVARAGDITVGTPSGSLITGTTLRVPSAHWIPDAFIGGTLNPDTTESPAVTYTIIDNTEDTISVQLGSNPLMTAVASDGNPFKIISVGAPFNLFELEGHTVAFTLDVEEDREAMGQETFNLRVGGIIRHLPPAGFDRLIASMSDRKELSSKNDADGMPEPGETIEIDITLRNISSTVDVDLVQAELDTTERDVRFINNYDVIDYGRIRRGGDRSGKFRFEIQPEFEGNRIVFQLIIDGRIDNVNEDLGIDEFVIPVRNQ